MFPIAKNWYELLKDEFNSNEFKKLQTFLNAEYATHKVYPAAKNVFNALNLVKFNDVKIVIIGQDPYHQPNQAHGLSFSVKDGTKIPPSLQNIFKEIKKETGKDSQSNGDLTVWAKQGVLLLNSVLTVRDSCPNSHKNKGWEQITGKIIKLLNEREDPVIFFLWGANAIELGKGIDETKHKVLKCSHPSPYSANKTFFGCNHFEIANEFLRSQGKTEIEW